MIISLHFNVCINSKKKNTMFYMKITKCDLFYEKCKYFTGIRNNNKIGLSCNGTRNSPANTSELLSRQFHVRVWRYERARAGQTNEWTNYMNVYIHFHFLTFTYPYNHVVHTKTSKRPWWSVITSISVGCRCTFDFLAKDLFVWSFNFNIFFYTCCHL